METKEIDLGEMISVWIEHHGSLDLDTPEEDIIKFYNEKKKKPEYGKCPECGANIQIWNCGCGDGHPY